MWPAANKETSRGGGVAIHTTTAASRIISASPSQSSGYIRHCQGMGWRNTVLSLKFYLVFPTVRIPNAMLSVIFVLNFLVLIPV